MLSMKDRVAVVTGASEGIGEAIVRRLAAEGMKVAALARREEKLAELERDLKDKGYMCEIQSFIRCTDVIVNIDSINIKLDKKVLQEMLAISLANPIDELETELKAKGYTVKGYIRDVQSELNVKAAFKSVEQDFGAVTVLVNNAGVFKFIPLRDLNIEQAQTTFNTNVIGVLSCTREALASMKNHSVPHGHIININSVAGHREPKMDSVAIYYASKHAITSLSSSLRNELKSSKIRVTSISPALVKTTMTREYMSQGSYLSYLHPSDIADAVVYALAAPSNVNVSEIILDNDQ